MPENGLNETMEEEEERSEVDAIAVLDLEIGIWKILLSLMWCLLVLGTYIYRPNITHNN